MWMIALFIIMSDGSMGIGLSEEYAYATQAECVRVHTAIKEAQNKDTHVEPPLPPNDTQQTQRCVFVTVLPSKK